MSYINMCWTQQIQLDRISVRDLQIIISDTSVPEQIELRSEKWICFNNWEWLKECEENDICWTAKCKKKNDIVYLERLQKI